jgi:hypothetical protein
MTTTDFEVLLQMVGSSIAKTNTISRFSETRDKISHNLEIFGFWGFLYISDVYIAGSRHVHSARKLREIL